MPRKRKRPVPKSGPVWRRTAEEATLDRAEHVQRLEPVVQDRSDVHESPAFSRRLPMGHYTEMRLERDVLRWLRDIALLAGLMGHESLETTRVYLRRTASEQRAAVDAAIDW